MTGSSFLHPYSAADAAGSHGSGAGHALESASRAQPKVATLAGPRGTHHKLFLAFAIAQSDPWGGMGGGPATAPRVQGLPFGSGSDQGRKRPRTGHGAPPRSFLDRTPSVILCQILRNQSTMGPGSR